MLDSVNARGLGLLWNQGYLLNDFISLSVEVVVIRKPDSPTNVHAHFRRILVLFISLSTEDGRWNYGVVPERIRIFLNLESKLMVFFLCEQWWWMCPQGFLLIVLQLEQDSYVTWNFFFLEFFFLGTPTTFSVDDWNAMLHLDSVRVADKRGNGKSLGNLLRHFQMSDKYRQGFQDVSIWTWTGLYSVGQWIKIA